MKMITSKNQVKTTVKNRFTNVYVNPNAYDEMKLAIEDYVEKLLSYIEEEYVNDARKKLDGNHVNSAVVKMNRILPGGRY